MYGDTFYNNFVIYTFILEIITIHYKKMSECKKTKFRLRIFLSTVNNTLKHWEKINFQEIILPSTIIMKENVNRMWISEPFKIDFFKSWMF